MKTYMLAVAAAALFSAGASAQMSEDARLDAVYSMLMSSEICAAYRVGPEKQEIDALEEMARMDTQRSSLPASEKEKIWGEAAERSDALHKLPIESRTEICLGITGNVRTVLSASSDPTPRSNPFLK